MAVQMSAPSTQDFALLQPKTDTASSNGLLSREGKGEAFRDILVSFHSSRGSNIDGSSPAGTGSKKEMGTASTAKTREALEAGFNLFLERSGDFSSLAELYEAAGLDEAAGDIASLIEAAQAEKTGKKGRFDPDAILSALSESEDALISPQEPAEKIGTEEEKSDKAGGADTAAAPKQTPPADLALQAESAAADTSNISDIPDILKTQDALGTPDAVLEPDEGGIPTETLHELQPEPAKETGKNASAADAADASALGKSLAAAESDSRKGKADKTGKEAFAALLKGETDGEKGGSTRFTGEAEGSKGPKDAPIKTETPAGQKEREPAENGENRGGDPNARGNGADPLAQKGSIRAGKDGAAEKTGKDSPASGIPSSRAASESGFEARGAGRASSLDSFASFAAELSDASQRSASAPVKTGDAGTTQILNPNRAFGEGITNVLEFLKNDGADGADKTSEARIVVEPPALGRIDVSLKSGEMGVEAAFKVDSENLKQVLQQQLDSLKSSLEAQGIHVSGLTVDIRNRDDRRGRSDAQKQAGRPKGISGAEAEDEGAESRRLVRLDLEKGLLHWVA